MFVKCFKVFTLGTIIMQKMIKQYNCHETTLDDFIRIDPIQ